MSSYCLAGPAAREVGSRRESLSGAADPYRAGVGMPTGCPAGTAPRSPHWSLEGITSAQAARDYAGCPIVDLRSPSEFCGCHLRDSLPLSDRLAQRGRWLERLVGRPRSVLIVADPSPGSGPNLSELADAGIERFLQISGDPYAWLNAGLAPDGVALMPESYLESWLRAGRPLLDVRDAWTREEAHWQSQPWIPLEELPDRLEELPAASPAILAGDSAGAALAAALLRRAGLPAVFVVQREPEVWAGQALFQSWDNRPQALAVALAA